jgi:hypothetical protein
MVETGRATRSAADVEHARRRHAARDARLAREKKERSARRDAARDGADHRKRATIARVMQRARERLKNRD